MQVVKWAGYKGTDEETSWLPAFDMPLKLSQTFTKPIPLSLGHCHLLSLDVFTCSNISERKLFFYISKKNHFLFYKTYVPFFLLSFSDLQLL